MKAAMGRPPVDSAHSRLRRIALSPVSDFSHNLVAATIRDRSGAGSAFNVAGFSSDPPEVDRFLSIPSIVATENMAVLGGGSRRACDAPLWFPPPTVSGTAGICGVTEATVAERSAQPGLIGCLRGAAIDAPKASGAKVDLDGGRFPVWMVGPWEGLLGTAVAGANPWMCIPCLANPGGAVDGHGFTLNDASCGGVLRFLRFFFGMVHFMFTRSGPPFKRAALSQALLATFFSAGAGLAVMACSLPARALTFTVSFFNEEGVKGQVNGVITGLKEGRNDMINPGITFTLLQSANIPSGYIPFSIESGPLSDNTYDNYITVSNGQVTDYVFSLKDGVGQFDGYIDDYINIDNFAALNSNPFRGTEYNGNFQANVFSPVASVPGPLPVLGASAAFAWSRRLRRRCQRSGRAGSAGPRA